MASVVRSAPPDPPRRDEIASATVGILKPGGPTKADLLVVDRGEGPLVVKDFGTKSAWVRLLGRVQIAREAAAYRWLDGVAGLPAFLGRIDAHALALEKVDAAELAKIRDRFPLEERRRLWERLRERVEALHARGLVHLDLRGRENVLVRPDGGIVILDLAGAVRTRPGGLLHRLLFPLLAPTDRAALLKWKDLLIPGERTPEDEAFDRRFRRWRRLWPFNRKRRP